MPRRVELLKVVFMSTKKYQLSRKKILFKPQLSTIFEWSDDGQRPCQTEARQSEAKSAKEPKRSKIIDCGTYSADKLPKNPDKFGANFLVASIKNSRFTLSSDLMETPWDDTKFYRVTSLSSPMSQRGRNTFLRPKRSKKEQDCIELWLKFFG